VDNVAIKVNNPHFDKDSIAVLGPRGSHSDSVANLFSNEKKIYVDSISKIIEAVRSKKIKQGIIPIENSIHGTIVESLDGINNSNLYITKAIVTPIHHSCVALNNHVEIDSVISHPQALAQCSKYINKKFPNARLINALSTADALEKLKINQLTNAVAIGTKIGAELYGLKIIDEKIENTKQNKTKFVIISKKSKLEGNMSSISILPFHEKQGILFNLLKFLDDKKINLTKIESRPLRNQLGKYIFYVDFDGNINEQHIKQAIKNIEKEVGIVKILGSYEVITNDK
jgi:prephenate dehydratase